MASFPADAVNDETPRAAIDLYQSTESDGCFDHRFGVVGEQDSVECAASLRQRRAQHRTIGDALGAWQPRRAGDAVGEGVDDSDGSLSAHAKSRVVG